MQQLQPLSTGQQEFSVIRTQGRVYVDKTMFIHKLLLQSSIFFFLSRARRFGKSLFINTLKELFLGKKELFEGLYIYDKIQWETFPVLHFDFSNMGFKDIGLTQAIDNRLNDIAASYGVVLQKQGIGLKFAELMAMLHEKTGKQAVILIDEYDKPITDVLEVGNNAKAHEHRSILRGFYGVVKGSSAHIRLFFMTGISRFSKLSLFSDLNNLTDLTYFSDFHDICGYTQEELETNFAPHLQNVADYQGISLEELLQQVKRWYNGYSWNGRSRVYNPYSVLRFLDAKEFRNYWFDSGTPKFLIEMLKSRMVYDISETQVTMAEADNFDIDNLSLETLLFQTGYLTVKEIDEFKIYTLAYPNLEVEESMTQYILAAYANRHGSAATAINIARAVKKNDMAMVIQAVNSLFASIPYQLFDQHRERYFHAIIFLAFKLCGFYIQSEVSVAAGRIDAVMHYENRIYVFEFKLNDSAENALQQIRQKGYYNAYRNQGKEIYLLGIGFDGQTRTVADWKMEQIG
ncbi:ATP-binding protein [Rhodoflexus caldus]|uniref:ATP-binding protein n=1 Tax=Rhodoflexus caldus TaxID=2891236 RepID=UPI00202A41AE|nr:ATP-binding protein [Rhodoflexus caldus]